MKLAIALKRNPVDVIWSPANFVGIALPNRLPQVATVHDLQHRLHPDNFSAFKRIAREVMFRLTFLRARKLIAISNFTRDGLINHYKLPGDKIVAVSSGVGAANIPSDEEVQRVIKSHGLRQPYLFYPASMTPHKGQLFLMKVFALLKERVLDLRLVFSGQRNSFWNEVVREAERVGVADDVKHVGFVARKDVFGLKKGAAAVPFASRFEGFGLPLLEAMQCGTPVVAADTSAIPEVVGEGGLLLQPDDAESWADALAEIVTDPATRRRMVAAGYANVARFSWDRCARETIDVLREAAAHALTRAVASWLVSLPIHVARVWLRLEPRASLEALPVPLNWTTVREILVVKLDGIGDAVLLTPFLRELRRSSPAARVTYVASPATAPLLEHCPYVDELIVFNTGVARIRRPLVQALRAFLFGRRVCRDRAFDVAIVPRWDTDSEYAALLVAGTNARARITYSERTTPRKQFLNRGFDALYTFAYCSEDELAGPRHEVLRNSDLLSAAGGHPTDSSLELWPDARDEAVAAALMVSVPAQTRCVVALGIGAALPHRQWPAHRFVAIANWISRELGGISVLIGGRGDVERRVSISSAIDGPCVDAVGRLSLLQTAALLKHCDLYVGNDTGPMHLAAAAGMPIVEISACAQGCPDWHWNSPARFGPWNVPSRVLRPERCVEPCKDSCTAQRAHCIRLVSISDVAAAIVELIGASVVAPRTSSPI